MSNWKTHERRVAKRLNGTRSGATGTASADVLTPHFSVECKHRQQLPIWLARAVRQAQNGSEEKRIPIVVLHELNRRADDDIVCLRMADFERLAQAYTDILYLEVCKPDVLDTGRCGLGEVV